MLRRGLATLDELKAIEEQEKKEVEEKAGVEQDAPFKDPFITNALNLAFISDLFKAVSPFFQAKLGDSSKTLIRS